jgi:hypothetical protein
MGTGSKKGLGIVIISNALRSDEFVEKLSGSDDICQTQVEAVVLT